MRKPSQTKAKEIVVVSLYCPCHVFLSVSHHNHSSDLMVLSLKAKLLLCFANLITTKWAKDLVFNIYHCPKKIKNFLFAADLIKDSMEHREFRGLFDLCTQD